MVQPPLPAVRLADPALQLVIDSLRYRINQLSAGTQANGTGLDRAVTFEELLNAGIVGQIPTAGGIPIPEALYPAPGPAERPYDLITSTIGQSIKLTWSGTQTNVKYYEVWRGTVNDRNLSTKIGHAAGPMYLDSVNWSESYYYWVRAIDTLDAPSRYNLVVGTLGTTGIFLDFSIADLSNSITSTELNAALNTEINKIGTLVSDTSTLASRINILESESGELDAAEGWLFVADDESWTAANTIGTNTQWQTGGYIEFRPDTAGAQTTLTSPAINVDGSQYQAVVMRIKLNTYNGHSTSEWDGTLQYSVDSGHSFSATYEKQVTAESIFGVGADWPVDEWVIVTWDMSDVADWTTSTFIDQLQFSMTLDNTDAGKIWHIDWIKVATFDYNTLAKTVDGTVIRVDDIEGVQSTTAASITQLEVSSGLYKQRSQINPLNSADYPASTGWSIFGSGTIDPIVSYTAGTDTEVMQRITSTGSASVGCTSDPIILSPTDLYEVSMRLWSPTTTTMNVECLFLSGDTARPIKLIAANSATTDYELLTASSSYATITPSALLPGSWGGLTDIKFYVAGNQVSPTDIPYGMFDGVKRHLSPFESTLVDGFICDSTSNASFSLKMFISGMASSESMYVKDVFVNQIRTVGDRTRANLDIEASVRSSQTGDLFGQYTVKLDIDGKVSGFGLASEPTVGGATESSFQVVADRFAIVKPGAPGTTVAPFVVDTNTGQVAIAGTLISDGSITADKIQANTITVDEVDANFFDAITAEIGNAVITDFTTSNNTADYRLKLSQTDPTWAAWYGVGADTSIENGLFVLDKGGNVTVKGIIESSIIKTSAFRPSGAADNIFRIQCVNQEFVPTGKFAHFNALEQTVWEASHAVSAVADGWNGYAEISNPNVSQTLPVHRPGDFWSADAYIDILSPVEESDQEYMRCGTYGEVIRIDADFRFYSQQFVYRGSLGTSVHKAVPLCGYRYQYLGLDDVWEPERFECYADPTTDGWTAYDTAVAGYGTGSGWASGGFVNTSVNTTLNVFQKSTHMARTSHVGDVTTVRDPRVEGILGWKRLRIFPCMRITTEALHRDGAVAWTRPTNSHAYVNEMNMIVSLPNFGYGTYQQQAGGALGQSIADTDLDGMVSTGRHGKPLL